MREINEHDNMERMTCILHHSQIEIMLKGFTRQSIKTELMKGLAQYLVSSFCFFKECVASSRTATNLDHQTNGQITNTRICGTIDACMCNIVTSIS